MDFSHSTSPVTDKAERILPSINQTDVSHIDKILEDFKHTLQDKTQHHLGYPYNLHYDYDDLKNLIQYSLNNLGDPFVESNYGVHSRMFEIAVLDWFAELWEIAPSDYWGYITSCGTEGNLHGIYLGRENLPTGILYTSADSHYSVFKAARMYRMECECIKSNEDGTICLKHLSQRLEANKGKPAILNVNIGTTLKGGIDDLDGVIRVLEDTGYSKDDFYIHCDGALVGIMISFLENRYLSFASKPIGSISVSGHKFIGSPIPCGVIVTRMEHMQKLANNIDYINSRDATIMGSRNGHAPLYLWYSLVKKGIQGIKGDIDKCISNARYLHDQLKAHGVASVLLNKWSNTVVFQVPSNQDVIRKWQLACSKNLCHIVVMPNIDRDKIDLFVRDYVA